MKHHRWIIRTNAAKTLLIIANAVVILWLTYGSFAQSSKQDAGLQEAVVNTNKAISDLTTKVDSLGMELKNLSAAIIALDTLTNKGTIQ